MTNSFPPGYSPEPDRSARSQGGRGPLYIGIAILLAILVAAVGFIVFRGGEDKEMGEQGIAGPTSTTEETSNTPQETETQGPSSEGEATTATETVPPEPEPESPNPQPRADMPSGLTPTGWNSFASCVGGESLVFAGGGPDGQIAVCQSVAGMTYRSTMFGGTLEAPATESDGSYYVEADPAIIIVTPSGVTVREGGGLAGNADFSQTWQR